MAAKSLGVSQPTLSRNVKSLEALVGAPLLKRGRYGVTPTLIGELLARDGRAIRDALSNAGHELEHWKGGLEGRLRIGVGTMLAHSLMPEFLLDPPTVNWKVVLKVEVEGPDRLIERVLAGSLDMALVEIAPYFPREELTQVALFEDKRAYYAGERHPLAKRKNVSANDISMAQHVRVGAYGDDRRYAIRDPSAPDVSRQRIELTGDVGIALHLLASGGYIALLPEIVMAHLSDDRKFVRLPYSGPLASRTLAIWHRADMAGHPLIKTFCRLFTAFVSDRVTKQPVA